MKIKQIYVPWWEWEDYINGMWKAVEITEDLLNKAIEFTGDHRRYGSAMREVVNLWPRCMLNALTNSGINQRAFVGHCAVTYKIGIPEYITRMAWGRLTNEQRVQADREAQETINEWKLEYVRQNSRVYQNLGETLLF